MLVDLPDFRNFTSTEAMEALREKNLPELAPLIRCIAMSIAFDNANYTIRVAIADAERKVEAVIAAMLKDRVS